VYVGSLRVDPFGDGTDRTPGDAYRIDAPGEAVTLYTGVGLSNGIGFSPDGRRLYHVDSTLSGILVHEIDESGEVVADSGAVFATVDKATPDGLAVDTDGGVWVALYGRGCVARFDQFGTIDRRVAVPAKAVTSLCFSGEYNDELIIVTADNSDDASRGGTIFRVSSDMVGATGLPAPLARI
jgi:sugar lactone lactonase YvrE